MTRAVHPDVVSAARVGAGWAFERLYEELAPAMLGYLRARGATDPEAGVQEVFLRAFRAIDSFTGPDVALRSWLFAIARNLLVDEARFRGRRPEAHPLSEAAAVPGGDVEGDALARMGTGRVRAVLDALAPDQRDVLLLRFVADLSLEEVAEATGRSTGAVKALQHRGLAALRRRLAEIPSEAVSPDGLLSFT